MEKDIVSLLLVRCIYTTKSTFGRLYINGNFFCYTLEDVVRGNNIKIFNETAIPQGYYEVIINYSNRFNRETPILKNVPNFDGIRIHSGNNSNDTSGCILAAYNTFDNDTIYDTAEKDLTQFLKQQKNKIFLTIVNLTQFNI